MTPVTEARLTILPPPCARIRGATSLMAKNVPFTLMSIRRSYSASLVSPAGVGSKMPAELTRMSMRPKAAFTSATRRLTAPTWVTSATNALASPPCAAMRSATPCALPMSAAPATATRAPSAANLSATASPISRRAARDQRDLSFQLHLRPPRPSVTRAAILSRRAAVEVLAWGAIADRVKGQPCTASCRRSRS